MDILAQTDALVATPIVPAVSTTINEVLEMTRKLFPGKVDVREQEDPEISDRFVVFHATTHGTVEEVVDREREWHHRIVEMAPDSLGLYRLSIDVC